LRKVNGIEPIVLQHDEKSVAEIRRLDFDNIVISSGPGHPENKSDFDLSIDVIKQFDVPILGISLGCQGIATCFGAQVIKAKNPVHRLTSKIMHNQIDILHQIPNAFQAVRYHSLIIDSNTLPTCLERIAWTKADEIMGIRH